MGNKLASLIKNAELLRNQNKLSEALNLYQKICNLDKSNPNAWLIYGSVAGHLGKNDLAEVAFRKACKLNKRFGKHNELLIQVLEIQNKYSEAITMLLNINSSDMAPNDIALRIGVLYGKTGEYEQSIEWLNKFINAGNNNAFVQHCLASAYEANNMLPEAEERFKKALSFNNNDKVILNNYAALLQKTGKIDLAIDLYKQSINVDEQYPISQYNLADLYLSINDYEAALKLFDNVVKLRPDYLEAIIGQGRCYQKRGANLHALTIYEKAVAMDTSLVYVYIYMAQTLSSLSRFDEALNSLRTAIKLDPENIETLCAIATIYENRDEFDKAEEIIRPLLISAPEHYDVVMAYASLCKKLNECESAVSLINKIVNDKSISDLLKAPLHFKAGKILDETKQYDDAFQHYSLANEYQNFSYDEKIITRSYENITNLFSISTIDTLPKSMIKSDAPIFIVGMPRSGTTLVEQIISSLPEVYGAGELPYLFTLSRQIAGNFAAGNECITNFKNLDQQHLNALTEQYLQSTLNNTKNESYFTDKMPHNFTMIGLINVLFPDSKIIHCQRNPIDNCLSIYFSEFNSKHPYACNLKNLAKYYTDYYQKLMAHWENFNQLPLYNISYEDIVNDQESTSRKLIDFCGLEWNDICLDFHQSKRDVATISYDQVRQPIYNRSVERWRNYEKHIEPLLEHFKDHT